LRPLLKPALTRARVSFWFGVSVGMTDDLDEPRRRRARHELADRLLEDFGGDAETLGAIVGTAPDQIREDIHEALERQVAYRAMRQRRAAMDESEGIPADRCCNMVCPEYKQSEGQREVDSGDGVAHIEDFGKRDYCTEGSDRAQGCIFRMAEHPPSDPWERYPSHAEAIRMLQRLGKVKPDDFGHWNGTAFAQQEATAKLWWAYLDMLVETGKISAHPFEGDTDNPDRGAQANDALDILGYPPHDAEMEVERLREGIRRLKKRDIDLGDEVFRLFELLPEGDAPLENQG
jgi:hypothetical protein